MTKDARSGSKGWRKAIQVISFLGLAYAVLGYVNQNYLHLVRSFWLSGYSDKIAIVAFGIWRVAREKNDYTRRRIAVLVFFITTIWILIPYLSGSSFFNHHVIGSAWFFAYLGIIFLFGRRADCSWNCPCVGLRDTAGDAFRGTAQKGGLFWKLRHLKWVFLASLLVYLYLVLGRRLSFASLPLPSGPATQRYFLLFWTITNALYFASLLIIPFTGNRNYCRYACPWGALYGIVGKLGFFKIVADRDACVQCRKCDRNCDMGVPISDLVQQRGEIKVVECVGCGRCVEGCPRGALRMVDVRDQARAAWPAIKRTAQRVRGIISMVG